MDATLVETDKSDALWSYKGFQAYQPLNTWWSEQGMVLHTEFRDGNVPAGFEQRRVLQEALQCLPEGVNKVRLRSDTAGYQHDLLKYCDRDEHDLLPLLYNVSIATRRVNGLKPRSTAMQNSSKSRSRIPLPEPFEEGTSSTNPSDGLMGV